MSIVTGTEEPPCKDDKGELAVSNDEGDDVVGIPDFWLCVLRNHEVTEEQVSATYSESPACFIVSPPCLVSHASLIYPKVTLCRLLIRMLRRFDFWWISHVPPWRVMSKALNYPSTLQITRSSKMKFWCEAKYLCVSSTLYMVSHCMACLVSADQNLSHG